MIRAILFLLLATPYEDAYQRSIASGRPLVVGVGCMPPAGQWEIVLVRSLEGFKGPCIVVSRPKGGSVYWLATLPPTATAAEVQRLLDVVTPPARKYDPYRTSAPVRAANC